MHLASLVVHSKRKQASLDSSNRLACKAVASSVWACDSLRWGWIRPAAAGLQRKESESEVNRWIKHCGFVLTSVNTTLFTHKNSVNLWGEWHTFTQKHKDVEHETDTLMFSFQHTINGLTHKVPLPWLLYRCCLFQYKTTNWSPWEKTFHRVIEVWGYWGYSSFFKLRFTF